ncbi:hypothetical protein LHK_02211 [Laribacter hongkongensis HLHK9]|uniref:Uncharacterized protein n=1 Tax=Laribacter hongkongensis (strain HLHK9) TaxID=557598 RepID=C1DA80_LARHH|nr:hypothetical protein LHK_02211 [Laribacter hongkongensis HLHK9]
MLAALQQTFAPCQNDDMLLSKIINMPAGLVAGMTNRDTTGWTSDCG